jgi:iron complex outermembrane recepter protein
MAENRMLGAWRPFVGVLLTISFAGLNVYSPFVRAAASTSVDVGTQAISIPPGTLVDALERIAKQFGLELVYDADQLKGFTSPGVSGRMTAMAAVRQLLEGQNLRLIEHPDGAILVTPPLTEDSKASPAGSTAQQLGTGGAGTGPEQLTGPRADQDSETTRRETVLNKIVVTGTHIEDETPVGSSLSVHTRDEIERSGSATLEQFGRKMTENYSGTDSLSTLNTNGNLGIFEQGAASNVFGGAGFNLKGLGPGSTLTLINGHRLAAGGLDGSTVDISQIPLSAIDHIEVLDDGASAIYGSDAVAGVVNIITRHEFDGAETTLRYGRATQGGAAETTASQIMGRNWAHANVMLDYEYDDQGGLDASQRSWIGPQGGPFSLIPENRRHSIYLTGSDDIADDSTISTDILYSDRHFETNGIQNATDPLFNNFQRSAGHAAQSSVVVNFSQGIFDTWTAGVTGNYSSVRQTSNSTSLALGGGNVGGNESQDLQANSAIQSIDGLLTGSVIDLPGGALKVSLGGAYRWEQFNSAVSSNDFALTDTEGRHVASAYGEIIAPVIENGDRGLRRFELSAAFRFDRYQSYGTTRNPKFGWLWEPMTGMQLKGTGGTSFTAPLLSQLGAPVTSYTALFPSLGSGGKDDVLITNGSYPGLHAGNATSITIGIDLQPAMIQGLTTSLNYFWLRFDNRIQAQNVLPEPILSQPQLTFITDTTSSAAAVLPYFQSPGFLGDGAGLGPAGVDLIVFNQYANTTSTIERGLNASSRYRWNEDIGHFDMTFAAEYLLSDLLRTATYEPQLSIDNTIGEPPKFKGRGDVSWTSGTWIADLAVNYVNSYRNTLFTPSQSVGAWTTADAYVGYITASDASRLWSNVQIGLSAQNLFDRRPPFIQIPPAYLTESRNAIPFDGANASPVGRQLSLQFKKRW